MILYQDFEGDVEPCPYLPDRESLMEYAAVSDVDGDDYDRLLASGWRIMGHFLFRPRCRACQECVPIRVPTAAFSPSRSQRRVLRKNPDVRVIVDEPQFDLERLRLHESFHAERTRTRNWPASDSDPEHYLQTFVINGARTLEFAYRIDDRLVGIAIVGESQSALNSIYAFFDPEFAGRSLGTFDVLSEIEHARTLNKQWVYLGYWVSGCSSMEYKSRFRPHELLGDDGWHSAEKPR